MSTTKLKDAIEAYKNGDESAFSTIYEESKGYIYTCISNTLNSEHKNEDIIQDIMQDTYLEVSKSLDKLENTDSFLFWAKTIANRKCYATLKKNDKYVLLSEEENFDNLPDEDNAIPEEIVINKEKQEKVREVINNDLTEGEKDCVVSYFYNDMKQSEIAEELGMPENTVKSNIHRAKSKMRQALEGVLVLAVVASIALLLVNSQIIKEATKVKNKKEEPTTVTQESTEAEAEAVVDGTAVPGGIISEGCSYYVATTAKTLVAGERFPMILEEGDKYITKDYEYYFYLSEWNVSVRDNTQISYEEILSDVMGEEVTNLHSTFEGCTNLTKAPKIPSSITSMHHTFTNCTNLVEAPEIPDGVTEMYFVFGNCASLVKAPEIPSGVTSMDGTFGSCTSLVEAPEIPDTVTSMGETFYGCTSLTGNIVINANPIRYEDCFKDVDFAKQRITLSGSPNLLAELRLTGINEYVFVVSEDCTYYMASTGETLGAGKIIFEGAYEGDIYSTRDYEYKFHDNVNGLDYGWTVKVKDKTKEEYEDIENSILGSDIRTLRGTFSGCTNLKEAPKIPESVENMEGTFEGCTSLVKAPVIPENVMLMQGTFKGCTELIEAPEIPKSVICMYETFRDCTSLTGNITMNMDASVKIWSFSDITVSTIYNKCFYGVDLTAQNITLSGNSTILENVRNTEVKDTDNKNVVEYGDTIRVSWKSQYNSESDGLPAGDPSIPWIEGEEKEFVVDIKSEEFDDCVYGTYYPEVLMNVEEALGKTVGETFTTWCTSTDGGTEYKYTILEIKKGQ